MSAQQRLPGEAFWRSQREIDRPYPVHRFYIHTVERGYVTEDRVLDNNKVVKKIIYRAVTSDGVVLAECNPHLELAKKLVEQAAGIERGL